MKSPPGFTTCQCPCAWPCEIATPGPGYASFKSAMRQTDPEQLRVLVAAREVLLEEAHPALRLAHPRPVGTRRTVEANGEKLVTLERLETLLLRQVTPQPVQQLLT